MCDFEKSAQTWLGNQSCIGCTPFSLHALMTTLGPGCCFELEAVGNLRDPEAAVTAYFLERNLGASDTPDSALIAHAGEGTDISNSEQLRDLTGYDVRIFLGAASSAPALMKSALYRALNCPKGITIPF